MSNLTRLAFNVYESATISKPPLVLLHGIFGAKQDWRVVAHHLNKISQRRIYAADLPNHGESEPRTNKMDATTMCRDVIGFLNQVAQIERSYCKQYDRKQRVQLELLGHSLGGMISMITALKSAEAEKFEAHSGGRSEVSVGGVPMCLQFDLSKLVVVDMSPHRYRREHGAFQRTRTGDSSRSVSLGRVLELLNSVELDKFASVPIHKVRREVDRKLEPLISYRGLRAFLRMSLRERNTDDGRRAVEWYFNLDGISRNAEALLSWPAEFQFDKLISRGVAFNRPVLFLGGSYSDFVDTADLPELRKVFPQCEMQHIEGAGHWVQADKPLEFVDIVAKFIDTDDSQQVDSYRMAV